MGRGHFDYEGTRLLAVCDVDKTILIRLLLQQEEIFRAITISVNLLPDLILILFTLQLLLTGMVLFQKQLLKPAKISGVKNL